MRIALMLGALSIAACAQDAAGCRGFVQQFLDWYVPAAAKGSFDVAIERRPEVFSVELLKALKEDAAARQRVSDDVVGLDFDPFLYTQDPSRKYEARGAVVKDQTCTVEIWPAARRSGSAEVVAEVRWDAGGWKFSNFRYLKDKTNLLAVLTELRKERKR